MSEPRAGWIPVPEPNLTPAAMIERARALKPMVRDGAAAAERRGCYSPELQGAFRDAGFFRILQPRRYGGYEFDVPTFFKVIVEIASADPGTGWCLCLGAGHALLIGSYYPESVQAAVFGPDGHVVAPGSAGGSDASCSAIPVEGGYRVSGTWRYSSGAPYSTHFMAAAKTPASEGTPSRTLFVIVPRSEYTILDDWGDILGLRASGSNSIVIEETFVPEEFASTLPLTDHPGRQTPGLRLHGNPLYSGVFTGFAAGELVCSQVGAAKGALAEYERIIRSTRPRYAPEVMKYQHHDWQRVFGLSLSMTQAAEALLMHSAELYMEYSRADAAGTRPFTTALGLELQGIQHQASRLAWNAGLEMFRAASSTSSKDGQPMQRFFRDLATFQSNASHQPEITAQEIAKGYFGLRAGLEV